MCGFLPPAEVLIVVAEDDSEGLADGLIGGDGRELGFGLATDGLDGWYDRWIGERLINSIHGHIQRLPGAVGPRDSIRHGADRIAEHGDSAHAEAKE
jgi:hypothetical protein